MRYLIVGPYPPLRDGVGAYALQELISLKEDGHEVEALSPTPTAAHHHVNLKGGFRLMKLKKISRRYDQVVLNYQPSHYHAKGGGISRLVTDLSMLLTFSSIKNLSIVCHEAEYPKASAPRWHPFVFLEGRAWRKVRGEVIFHSERELRLMKESFGGVPKRARIREHDIHFRPFFDGSREEARDLLGISSSEKLLLCIGFVQPHKGFDRAMRAFAAVPDERARLVVVGSVRTHLVSHGTYAHLLKELADNDKRIEFRPQMLSDTEFDQWIAASDLVLLPYREIWSSSVMARAHLLNRPVIATNVGGVPDQAGPDDTIVEDDRELQEAIARFLGVEMDATSLPLQIEYDDAVRLVSQLSSAQRDQDVSLGSTLMRKDMDPQKLVNMLLRPPQVIPSTRPVLGPLITIVKRVLNKIFGRVLDPRTEAIRMAALSALERLDAIEKPVANSREDS